MLVLFKLPVPSIIVNGKMYQGLQVETYTSQAPALVVVATDISVVVMVLVLLPVPSIIVNGIYKK